MSANQTMVPTVYSVGEPGTTSQAIPAQKYLLELPGTNLSTQFGTN